ELVALGLVNADGFAGLRALLTPAAKRPPRRRGPFIGGMADAGRWALLRGPQAGAADPDALEHVARVLLRRYGVVFWRLLEREADWLPPWRELLRVYHRLEARGEIRGGRFVTGISGELIRVSGSDPLNLAGTLLPGEKVPALAGNRLLYRDGVPV